LALTAETVSDQKAVSTGPPAAALEIFEQVKIKTSEQINFAGDEKTGPVDCRPYQEVSFEYALQIKGHRKKG